MLNIPREILLPKGRPNVWAISDLKAESSLSMASKLRAITTEKLMRKSSIRSIVMRPIGCNLFCESRHIFGFRTGFGEMGAWQQSSMRTVPRT